MRTHTTLLALCLAFVLSVSGQVLATALRPGTGVASAAATQTILGFQGTAWLAETPAKLSLFRHYGWGTAVRRKATAAADQWVHMPLTAIQRLNGADPDASWINFCAQSSGVNSMPIRVDLWENNNRIQSTSPIPWPYGKSYGCYVFSVGDPQQNRDALGISVLLHFANATDTITLYDLTLGFITM